MAKLRVTKNIDASVERTFTAFSNVNQFADVASAIESVELLTDGPIGVGTRFRETRVMFGKQATEEMEFTAYQPHQTYTIEAHSHGSHYISTFDFKPSGDGTEVALTFEAKPISLFAKIMTPLAKLMTNSVRKAVEQDFDDVKAHLESQPAVSN